MRLATAFALSLIATSAQAAGFPDSIDAIPLADCKIKTVATVASFHNVQRQGELAAEAIKALDEMKKSVANAKTPGVSVGKQMTLFENAKFTEARQHNIAIGAMQLIESDYARDMKAVLALVQSADTTYRWETTPAQDSPEFVYYGVLELMQIALPKQKLTIPAPSRTCTTDLALHVAEDESLVRLNKFDLKPVFEWLESTKKKYKMQDFDRTKLSADEAQRYDTMMSTTFNPALKEQRYLHSLEYIKLIAIASEMTYQSNKKDLVDSGGNIESIGNTINKMYKDQKIVEPLTAGFNMREVIAKKVPSEMSKQLKAMGEYNAELVIKYPVKD